MQWFRMYAEAVDDDKLRLLAFEDRWHYVALLCLKSGGILDSDPKTLDRRVALKLGLLSHDLGEVKRRLMEVGLIDKRWQPIGWDKRQFRSDSSAGRTRQWRERHRDVTVTDQIQKQITDTEAEEEKKQEWFGPPAGLNREAFERYAEYLSSIGKPLAPLSIHAAQRRLAAFGDKQAEVVEQTIANSWKGLFHVKPNRDEPKKSTWRAPVEDESDVCN